MVRYRSAPCVALVGIICVCLQYSSAQSACDSSPCRNGATCVDSVVDPLGYVCLCAYGFNGAQCEQSTSNDCGYDSYTPSGTVASPNYPSNYTERLFCFYNIRVANASSLTLTFGHLEIELVKDYVEIAPDPFFIDTRQPDTNVPANLIFSDFYQPPPGPITLDTNQLVVSFTSDKNINLLGWTLSYESTLSPCATNPCENGGSCQHLPTNNYDCTCTSEWQGINCSTPVDPCLPNPCLNGACQMQSLTEYFCLCDDGWTGDLCDMGRVIITDTDLTIISGDPVREGTSQPSFTVNINLTPASSSFQFTGTNLWSFDFYYSNLNDGNGNVIGSGSSILTSLQANTAWQPPNIARFTNVAVTTTIGVTSCSEYRYLCVIVRRGAESSVDYELVGSPDGSALWHCAAVNCRGVEISGLRLSLLTSALREGVSSQPLQFNLELESVAEAGSVSGTDLWRFTMFASASSNGLGDRVSSTTATQTPEHRNTPVNAGILAVFNNLQGTFNLNQIICPQVPYFCVEVEKGNSAIPDFTFTGVPDESILTTCVPVPCIGVQITNTFFTIDTGSVFIERSLSHSVDFSSFFTTRVSGGSVSGIRLWQVMSFASSFSDGSGNRYSWSTLPLTLQQSSVGNIAGSSSSLQGLMTSFNLNGTKCDQINYMCVSVDKGPDASPDFTLEPLPGNDVLTSCTAVQCNGVIVTTLIPRIVSGLPVQYGYSSNNFLCELTINARSDGASIAGSGLWNITAYVNNQEDGRGVRAAQQQVSLSAAQGAISLAAGGQAFFDQLQFNFDLSGVNSCDEVMFLCFELQKADASVPDFTLEGSTTSCVSITCQQFNACDAIPCQNEGVCSKIGESFLCTCAPGWTGGTCTQIVDNCNPNPCANGGQCVNELDRFTCICTFGFTGATCSQVDTGVEISATNLILRSGALRQSTSVNPFLLDISLTSTATSASASGSGLWQGRVFSSSSSSGGDRYAEQDITFTSGQASTGIAANSMATFSSVGFDFNFSNRVCSDGQYLCVEIQKGDNPVPDFILTGVPSDSSLIGCVAVNCIGVQITSISSSLPSGFPVIERTSSQGINFDLDIASSGSAGSAAGSGLWQLTAYFASSNDGSGTSQARQSIQLNATQAATGINAGDLAIMQNIAASMSLDGVLCTNVSYMCIELGRGDAPSVNYRLEESSDLETCIEVTCRGVAVTSTSYAATSGILQEGSANSPFTFDLVVDSYPQGASIEGTNLWSVELFSSSDQSGIKNNAIDQVVQLTSGQSGTSLLAGSSVLLQNVMTSLDLSTLTCADIPYLCTRLSRSDSANPDFTLEGFPGDETLTSCRPVSCEEPNTAPFFLPGGDFNNVVISESSLAGTVVYTMQGSDNEGDVLTYGLVGDQANTLFQVNSMSGDVTLRTNLDAEDVNMYTIFVSVSDGRETVVTESTVFVGDINDNPPVFVGTPYSTTVQESQTPGSVVFTVEATDRDSGINAAIMYELVEASDLFEINPTTGNITLIATLNFEESASYQLRVKASDGGIPSMESEEEVVIRVGDVQDSDPVFVNLPYSPTVTEETRVNSVVQVVSARDPDVDNPNVIEYTIAAGNDDEFFTVNTTTGEISLSKMIDLEAGDPSVFSITVRATEVGPTGGASAITEFTIRVDDVNDNDPVFNAPTYTTTISELSPSNTPLVLSITVNDPDMSVNSEYLISLRGPNRNLFSVTPSNGMGETTPIVSLESTLDYETSTVYTVEIYATDARDPTRETSSTIFVNLINENDNSPFFSPQSYLINVLENVTIGENVLRVTATDNDGDLITYGISSNPSFTIDPNTGNITTTNNLDYEEMTQYIFTVVASDNKNPARTATAQVTVNVENVNDNSPQFPRLRYDVNTFENANYDLTNPLHTLQATDADMDPNNPPVYSFVVNDPDGNPINVQEYMGLRIDSISGVGYIYTTSPIDYDVLDGPIIATIIAEDSDGLSDITNVYITVLDTNDNTPMFNQSLYMETVYENTLPGQGILQVVASDGDRSPQYGTPSLRYYIDPPSNTFSILQSTGEIFAVRNLDYETGDRNFEFQVLAIDSSQPDEMTGTAMVSITIADINDNNPQFMRIFQSVTAEEQQSAGVLVAEVDASDIDSPGQNSDITYSFIDGNNPEAFTINETTGAITTSVVLDYENTPSYTLRILAENSAPAVSPATGSATATVVVSVGDINDNSPQFTDAPYSFEVSEDRMPVSTIGVVSAMDMDSGVNGELTYSIIAGNIENSVEIFRIDPISGEITLVGNVDRERTPSYSLTVQVVDGAASPRIELVNIPITVLDVNDNNPIWIQQTYDVSITENSMAEVVAQVIATDADTGPNSDLVYEILSPSPYFTINNMTGQISTTGPIDAESESSITLLVSVRDNGFPSRQASPFAQVNFEIVDINDNSPMFDESDYVFTVEENLPSGTTVGQISAMDLDESDDLTYSLQGFDSIFAISSNNGTITTLRLLDREDVASYDLTARVSDGLNIGQVNVRIIVQDVNDNIPILVVQIQNVTVSESEAPGTFVTEVIASDSDSDSPITSFTITDGNINNAFIITSSGNIETSQSLDRESIPYYSLTIEATDSVLDGIQQTGTTTVGIIITDVNDNGPLFVNDSYSITVPEDVSQRTLVTVQATDADETVNAQINYRIIFGNINNAFEIDSITGEIRRGRAPLDREFIDAYSLDVEASNPGSNLANDYVRVNIIVEDVNDEVPEFSQLVYQRLNLDENSVPGTFVITVLATDNDLGAGGDIKYYIEQGNDEGKFMINEDDGEITVADTLNFELVRNYTLQISARDQASPFNTGIATVTIELSNVDEQTQFMQDQYRESVPEDIPINSTVLQVLATDPDQNTLIYSLSPNTPSSILRLFTIDPMSGEIRTIGLLDREVTDLYTFNVLASDGGAQEGSTEVRIDVEDVNDNNPTFDVDPVVLVTIPEGQMPNSAVTSFRATDPDDGVNGQVTYRIESGNSPTSFSLDIGGNNLVTLRTTRILDREVIAEYSIVVVASDGGNPSLNNSIQVNVTLEDINDNPPRFTASVFNGSIDENSPEGTPVVNVSATDFDAGNNARLTYSIQSGNTGNTFQINRLTGEITTTSTPTDREQLETYSLNVQVTDDGIPQFTESVDVSIQILDKNDETPTFIPSSVTYTTEEGPTSVGVEFGPVTAIDGDSTYNGQIEYTLLDGYSTFSIVPETGLLKVEAELDRETDASYVLTVFGVDQAVIETERLTGTATVTVIVQDINDNMPMFDQPSYGPVDIGEEQQGLVVGVYTATDEDENVITYSIDPLSQGLFEIDPDTGMLSLRPGVTLDFESEETHVITVIATDDGTPSQTGVTMVTVSVTNINDNTPEFEGAPYTTSVNDDTPPGSNITTITAIDADNQTDGLRYSIIQGNPDGLFRIDPVTGIVYLNKSAGNYGDQTFPLTIQVSDDPNDPTNSQSSITTLTVSVISVERPPVFASGLFIGSVDEGIEGAPVTVVPVVSVTGDGSQVTYSITGPDSDYFDIDPATGQLTTKVALDAETKDLYEFEIVATNSKGETDTADIQVMITNLNDNSPIFVPPQISINISEGTAGGETVGQVNATDPDGFPITYFISSGGEGRFVIDPQTGVITVAPGETIDGTPTYTLVISATDGGNPAQTGTSVVTINVANINNSPPYFTSDQLYRVVMIPEDTAVGTNIVNVTAKDDDNDAALTYSMTDSVMYDSAGREVIPSTATPRATSQQLFVLDSQTGVLNVDMPLDREVVETVRLTIKATDSNSVDPSQADSLIDAIVVVQIIDINDNTPVIEQLNVTSLVIEVTENADRGTLLTTFVATDPDKDENGRLEYVLVDETTDLVELIRETGHLVVNGEIDYEQIQWLNFKVRIQDMGTPSLYVTIPVYVRVIDVNDNSPVFQGTPYDASVSEGAVVGFPVDVNVLATDLDSGAFGEIIYTLSGGNDRFSIDQNTGKICVANELDRNQNQYFLTVTATDNPVGAVTDRFTSTVGVTIDVVIENRFTPIPGQSTYFFDVFENTLASTLVGEVTATDNDIGQAGELTFTISDTSPEVILTHLMINEELGVILTTQTFDREVDGDVIEFTVVISDNGTPVKSSTSTIVLTIKDVNDNVPQFDSATYSITVPEGLTRGSPVYTVLATDLDYNNTVRYSIVQGNIGNAFSLDAATGELTNNIVLDFDNVNQYNLTIAATDQSGMYSTTLLQIDILDLQIGSSITFSETLYRSNLPENVPAGTIVNQVTVNDNGNPVDATYSIVNGNVDDTFIIDPDTGIITTNRTLDWEANSQYYLIIQAKTGDTIAQAVLEVLITDVNDEPPKFREVSYSVQILENTKVDMEVEEVFAVDADDGGVIVYDIISGNDYGHFRIDNKTGKIYLAKTLLDRVPLNTVYQLVVQAQDSSNTQLFSNVNVSIEIIDINDHAPVFINPNEVFYVPENEPIGYVIGCGSAMDVDFGLNGELRYDLLRTEDVSRDWESFSINVTSSKIETTQIFDREEKDIYTIVVVATDQGNIQLSTAHEYTIRITDRDDNQPMFEQLVAGVPETETLDVDENSAVGTAIGSVPDAIDRDTDQYSQVYYYIVEGNSENYFSINKTTGEVSVNGELDREAKSSYRIVVKASSEVDYQGTGPYNVTTDFSLKEVIININDVNDNGPIFTQNPYFAAVAIDATVGKSIIRVSAVDPDIGDEDILYDITYSNLYDVNSVDYQAAADYFTIDRETGLVFLNKGLTSIKTGYFEVGLLAEDSTNSDLRDVSVLQVSLLTKDERVILIIDASVDTVRSKEEELTELLSNITGGMAVIDSIETYIDADGVTNLDQTQVIFHVINQETGEVHDGNEVNKLIQVNYIEIEKLFNLNANYALSSVEGGSGLGFFEWMWLILAILIFLAALIAAILMCCCVRRKKVLRTDEQYLTHWKGKKVRRVDEYGMDVLSGDSGIGADEADGHKNLYELQEVTLNMDNDIIQDNRQIQMTSFITPSGAAGGLANGAYRSAAAGGLVNGGLVNGGYQSTAGGLVNGGYQTSAGGFVNGGYQGTGGGFVNGAYVGEGLVNGGFHRNAEVSPAGGYQRLDDSGSIGNITVSSFVGGIPSGGAHTVSSNTLHVSNPGYGHSQQSLQQNGGSAAVFVSKQSSVSSYNNGLDVTPTRYSESNLRRAGSSNSIFSDGSVTVKVGQHNSQGSGLLTRTHSTTPQSGEWLQSSTIHVSGTPQKDGLITAKSEPNIRQDDNGFQNSFQTTVEKNSVYNDKDGGSVREEYTRTDTTTAHRLPAGAFGGNLSTSMLQNLHFHDISDDDDDDPKDRYAYAYNVDDRLSLSDSD
ncbi:cadherin-23-like [Antedon mediterranea]|uniref:cadherin-23-like n=1 Tax=Antedon mediterranea TaxID=105859 RepID=UPI003AF427BB